MHLSINDSNDCFVLIESILFANLSDGLNHGQVRIVQGKSTKMVVDLSLMKSPYPLVSGVMRISHHLIMNCSGADRSLYQRPHPCCFLVFVQFELIVGTQSPQTHQDLCLPCEQTLVLSTRETDQLFLQEILCLMCCRLNQQCI